VEKCSGNLPVPPELKKFVGLSFIFVVLILEVARLSPSLVVLNLAAPPIRDFVHRHCLLPAPPNCGVVSVVKGVSRKDVAKLVCVIIMRAAELLLHLVVAVARRNPVVGGQLLEQLRPDALRDNHPPCLHRERRERHFRVVASLSSAFCFLEHSDFNFFAFLLLCPVKRADEPILPEDSINHGARLFTKLYPRIVRECIKVFH